MKLTNEIVKTLEEIYFLAYLCSASKYGKPGARMVGLSISKDLSKIYIGNGRFNKAEKDLDENKNVMIVFYNMRENIYDIKGFQIDCELINKITDKNNEIFKRVYNDTEENVNKEEAESLKCAYVFDIKRIYDCSVNGGGKIILQ